jgi:hypothetical protein
MFLIAWNKKTKIKWYCSEDFVNYFQLEEAGIQQTVAVPDYAALVSTNTNLVHLESMLQ